MFNRNTRIPITYKDWPVVGLDIGTRTIKMAQFKRSRGGTAKIVGYAETAYPTGAIVEGIIIDPQLLADVIKPILSKSPHGRFTARRAAAAVPTDKAFIRVINLPPMEDDELDSAVMLETEQYVPVPIAHLYVDYEVVSKSPEGQTILMVAIPSVISDSYVQLFDLLELEPAFIQPEILSIAKVLTRSIKQTSPTLIVNIESASTSLAIYDGNLRLANTVAIGGDNITDQLVKKLGVTSEQAEAIKKKFGVGESGLQTKIETALKPSIDVLVREFTRMTHYYADHGGQEDAPVASVLLTGGTSRLPGLSERLSESMKLPVLSPDPWEGLKVAHGIKLPDVGDMGAYTTAICLARLGLTI